MTPWVSLFSWCQHCDYCTMQKEWIHAKSIPVRGKHLDDFSLKDYIFIGISKASTAPFAYYFLKFAYEQPNILWNPQKITIWNSLIPLPVLFIIFDLFYSILHWLLHLQVLYPYIHKHHHQQKAPSRANVDAVNVHPIEFLLGEFNHLWSLYICSTFIFQEMHICGALSFIALGGILAGLSHTRYDFSISIPTWNGKNIVIFDSKDHDVHHRIPQSNYGQYSMIWDRIFGTHR
jgi:sterol desaturase/sphingolipid hydroxylase (fatty acid hydroxylase superfamily)